MSNLITQLNWRYATKKFDPKYKLNEKQLDVITEALRLAPSSFGLQAWGFMVVADPKIRQKLSTAAWGQPQITDASQLIVLCRSIEMNQAKIDKYVAAVAQERNVDPASLTEFSQMMSGSIAGKSADQLSEWMAKQVYIALGVLLTSCAIEGIDACPMEGFDNAQFDEILDLKSKGLASCVLCAVGKRAADDDYAKLEKVRFPKEEIIFFV